MSVRRECLIIFVSLAGILLLASVIAFVLRLCIRAQSAKPVLDNLTARIKAWWVIESRSHALLRTLAGCMFILFGVLVLGSSLLRGR